jgi:hypothetical protein
MPQATYKPTLERDLDWVRLQIGDTDCEEDERAELSDKEIKSILASKSNKYLAAAEAGNLILARNQGVVRKQVGDLRLEYNEGEEKDVYQKHLEKLQSQGANLLMTDKKYFRVL